jgi:hypothetical protein
MARMKQFGIKELFAGGNELSQTADLRFGMDRYVHLCFRKNHPMQFLAKQRGQIEQTLWLHIDAHSVFRMEGVVFCPGVSNKSGMEMLSLDVADKSIDYEVLYGGLDLRNSEVRSRMAIVEKCEILVPDFIPVKYFERCLPNG